FLLSFLRHRSAATEIYSLSYTTLFRSGAGLRPPERQRLPLTDRRGESRDGDLPAAQGVPHPLCRRQRPLPARLRPSLAEVRFARSEEHTSELQSRFEIVCRLLFERNNN